MLQSEGSIVLWQDDDACKSVDGFDSLPSCIAYLNNPLCWVTPKVSSQHSHQIFPRIWNSIEFTLIINYSSDLILDPKRGSLREACGMKL